MVPDPVPAMPASSEGVQGLRCGHSNASGGCWKHQELTKNAISHEPEWACSQCRQPGIPPPCPKSDSMRWSPRQHSPLLRLQRPRRRGLARYVVVLKEPARRREPRAAAGSALSTLPWAPERALAYRKPAHTERLPSSRPRKQAHRPSVPVYLASRPANRAELRQAKVTIYFSRICGRLDLLGRGVGGTASGLRALEAGILFAKI